MSDLLGVLFGNDALGINFGKEDDTTGTNPPATVPAPVPATVDVKAELMDVMTCNVQNTPDLPRNRVVKAGKDVSGHFGVGGFQELGENGQDRSDVLKGLGSQYSMTNHGPAYVQEQIAWITERYTTGNGGWQQSIPASPAVPYPNPARGWTWQEFTTLGGITFLYVDTHFVNKAFNTVPDPHKAERKKNWIKHYNDLSEWLKPRVKVLPTFVAGDFNRLAFPPFTNNMRVLSANGIDKIFIGLPQGWRIKGGPDKLITTPSDHKAVIKNCHLDRSRAS